jgi:hypothetical protein
MTIKSFKREIAVASKAYDKFIVCLDKTPEDFEVSLNSLMVRAIEAYKTRSESASWHRAGQTGDGHLKPGRRCAAIVRHLFQPAFCISWKQEISGKIL